LFVISRNSERFSKFFRNSETHRYITNRRYWKSEPCRYTISLYMLHILNSQSHITNHNGRPFLRHLILTTFAVIKGCRSWGEVRLGFGLVSSELQTNKIDW